MPKSSSVTAKTSDAKPKKRLKSRYQRMVEAVESLTQNERERLAKPLQKNTFSARRARLIANVRLADKEFENGVNVEGSAEEIMRELNT